jgi:hypothetical protein
MSYYTPADDLADLQDSQAHHVYDDAGGQVYEDVANPIARLREAWIQEVGSPILLPYATDVMQQVRDITDTVQAELDELLFKENLNPIQEARDLDLQRTSYVMKAYLRTRLSKIQNHIFFITSEKGREMRKNMSDAESRFADSYMKNVIAKRLNKAVLSDLPKKWAGFDDIDDSPNVDGTASILLPRMCMSLRSSALTFFRFFPRAAFIVPEIVFVRVLRSMRYGEVQDLARDDVVALPYAAVANEIQNGAFQLLE